MAERTNDQWVAALQADTATREAAIADLRTRLQRGLFYYLSRERSDLADLATDEIAHMAEDFAQEATLRVLENLPRFRGDSQFTTWATKIAVRMAISEMRRARYRDFSLDALMNDSETRAGDASLIGASGEDGPELTAEKRDVLAGVERALQEALTPRQRAAFEALILEGVPLDIVADRLGTNRNALYKLIFDARRKIRAHLENQGLAPEYILELFEG